MKMSYFAKLYKTKMEKNKQVAIQRRGPILARIVILSVYGADTIAIDFSLSALIS
jgi:hypothetical protein